MIKQIKYHNINCLNCGMSTTSDLVAFDISKIISNTIGKESLYVCLKYIDLRLYLTIRDLSQEFNYYCDYHNFSVFKLTVGHVKRHLGYLLNKSFKEIQQAKVDSQVYDNLYRKLKVNDANYLINLMNHLINDNDNTVIVSIPMMFILDNDDNNHEYPIGIKYIINNKEYIEHTRVCPNCGNKYASGSGKHQEYVIGFSGLTNAGKTTYLNSLINRLSKPGKITLDDTYTKDSDLIPIRVLDMVYNFIFVDIPGKLYQDVDTNYILNNIKIINNMNIMYCFIDSNILGKDNLNEISNLTKTIETIYKNQQTAIILTKCDDINDNNNYILDDNSLNYNLIIDNIEYSESIIKKDQTIKVTLEETFNNYSLFSISSLHEDSTIIPFLWTLCVLNIVDAKKEVNTKTLFGNKLKMVNIDGDDLYGG